MMRELSCLALVAVLLACNKVKEPPPSQSSLTPAVQSAKIVAPPEPEPAVDLDSLPMEEDYEIEAEKAIVPNTLIDQVNALDKEISAK